MPEIMSIIGYKIYFWLNEGKPLEPIHVHVSKQYHKNATKIWILSNGKCELENNNDRIPTRDLKRIMDVIQMFQDDIKGLWAEKFGQIDFLDKGERQEEYSR